ncbi:MAG: phosphate propanoyltransferase [Clostridiales Family XIII bacterium]|jgi:putative phosphotransacetylase|nr:phosphate propanoyltransferase [Clostridiales Family XIII bacterium]
MMGYKVGIGVSNKHLHLSEEHLAALFGAGYALTPYKELVQPGQYAAEEKVDIVGPKGAIKGLRIIGPTRSQTQVELSVTDARGMGLSPPVVESGHLSGTPGVKVIGPVGEVDLNEGVMIALRHIHLNPRQAEDAGLKDHDLVDVATYGGRPLIFQDVVIRAGDAHEREFHIDTDEANAAGLASGDEVEVIRKRDGIRSGS